MDVDASKKIEDLKKDLAAGRIDQACYDIELEDIEGLESDVFDEEEQEVEEEPLVRKASKGRYGRAAGLSQRSADETIS